MTHYDTLEDFHTDHGAVRVPDLVHAPKHYDFFPDVETITMMASLSTIEEFKAYCFLTKFKYRARIGEKDAMEQELGKSNKYLELFLEYKHLCRTSSIINK